MATEEEVEAAVEELCEQIDAIACDSNKFSQQQSVDIYDGIQAHCLMWSHQITREMEDEL